MQPFTSERLYYRPFRRVDADAAFAFFGDPEVMHYSAFGVHADVARTAKMLAEFIEHNRRRGFGFWAVVERESDELIGMAGLSELPGDEVELAYRLRRDRWRRGYASEAARSWVDQGFSLLGLARIVAAVDPNHLISKRILSKLGMRFIEQRTMYDQLVDFMALERHQSDRASAAQHSEEIPPPS